MRLTTTKWTAEVIATTITRMGDKKNPTLFAPMDKRPKVGMILGRTTKFPIIERNRTSYSFLFIPVRDKFKKRLNLNYKKAKVLLVWLMKSFIPSLSLIEIKGQRYLV